MATRMAESLALIKRAERVGWRTVKIAGGGSKIYPPDGSGPHAVHLTYSDGLWSLKLATKALEQAGLTEAEEKMATARVTESRTKAANAAAQAEREAKILAAKAAVVKAAGPYLTEPEDVELAWFTKAHPAPWMRWVNVTVDIANTLLTEHNSDNRHLVDPQAEHYKDIILSNQWHLTHQGCAMDTRGILQDGQHRLQALVRASEAAEDPDLKLPFAFFVGMPVENFKAIDEGKLRTAAQLFGRGGDSVKNATTVQAAIRLIRAFNGENPRRASRAKVTNETLFDTFTENRENLLNSTTFGVSRARKAFTSTTALTTAHYLLGQANGFDNTYVAAFFEGLTTGKKAGTRLTLDDTDPRAVIREYFQSLKLKRKPIKTIEAVSIIITGWNNVVQNLQPRFVRFNDDTPIPRITRCADSGPNASACPELLYGEIDDADED